MPSSIPSAPAKLLLSSREAAAALSLSERTLWTMTQRGDVPCVRIGRRVLYSPAALAAWIGEQTTTSTSGAAGRQAP